MEDGVIPRRKEVISKHKDGGGFIAAVLPIHYPRELMRAFGFLPVEVWAPPGAEVHFSGQHLQPYICSIAHNALAFLLSGGLDGVDLLVVPHACDSLQGFGSILLDFIRPAQPVLPLYLPKGQRFSDLEFLSNELTALYHQLEAITKNSPTEDELMICIHREEEADDLLVRIHRNREQLPLDSKALYQLIRSREFLPAEHFIEIASRKLDTTAAVRPARIPVVLSGIVPEPMTLFETLLELGATVVADDLASCGRRLYPHGKSSKPFTRMAERLLYAPPDPMRGCSIENRLAYLLKLVRSSRARGVIFWVIKFCEAELFDLPQLSFGLRQENIPSLVVEMDLREGLSERLRNRLAAFLEMIQ